MESGQKTYGKLYNHNAVRQSLQAFKSGGRVNYTFTHDDYGVTVSHDFSTQGPCDVIACFAGHIHTDTAITTAGILYVTSDCSHYTALWPTTIVFANLFDVVTVDRQARKLYVKKFGSGLDRMLDY